MKKNPLIKELLFRRTFIADADSIFVECERLTSTPIDTSNQARRHWRRAAKLYERSADFYQHAGLGLRAIEAWKGAAKCFEALGMADEHERCRLKNVSIPIYYGEANDDGA